MLINECQCFSSAKTLMSFSLKYQIKVVNNRLQNTLFDFAILYERSVSNLFLLSHLIVFCRCLFVEQSELTFSALSDSFNINNIIVVALKNPY